MVNWQEIHLNFTEELAQNWQKEGFDFEQTRKWIDLGFNPNDYELVSFIKNKLGYNTSNILVDGSNIETFREIYQKNLEQKQQENSQMQEEINQSFDLDSLFQETDEDRELQRALALSRGEGNEIDMGWLTDDNIAYILESDEIIKSAENIQVRTDIANIYLQVEKAKKNEAIHNDFWNSLNIHKKYILLPLRVNGNHWSLLLFVNNEHTGKVNWLYYLSSLSISATTEEIKEISNFLKQVGKKFGSDGNSIINENDLSEIVFRENPRQPNTWDCGVYICEFVKFLCVDQYYNLNETNCQITSQQIKEFRERWKNKIGVEKWCKWDTINNNQKIELDEVAQLAEAIRLSLLATSEERQLNVSSQQQASSQRSENKEIEKLQQELANERSKNELLTRKLEALQKEKNPVELMKSFKEKLKKEDYEDLANFLEAHEEFTKAGNEYAKKQIEKLKKRLLKNEEIKEEDLTKLSQIQTELVNLKKELEEKIETATEVPTKTL